MKNCAGDNTVAALIAGALDPTAARGLERHLDACTSCRRLVADLGRGLSALSPERIGRYELRRALGVGGMGVVYEAHDSVLDRRVAVKVLRPDSACDQRWLLAEARAMARLSHRNIAAVHDAGSADGRVYLCMEYVAGTTLREWLADAPRTTREIVGAFTAAGRGLAYIHDQGVVHLDFKPDNVLVESGGRIVVTDFGVAAIVARTGAIAGTPRYMAPEQRRGGRADARADQYAFAVALGDALGAKAPGWARAVVARGTSTRASDRFDSMGELVAALEAGARRMRRRIASALAVAVTAALSLVVVRAPEIVTRVIEHQTVERVPVRVFDDHANEPAPHEADSERATPRDAGAVVRALSVALAATRRDGTRTFAFGDQLLAGGGTFDRERGEASACDDGSERTCALDAPPWCPAGSTLALQDGCWTCADERGCAPLGIPHACDDGSPLRCTRSRPACSGHELPSIRGGCWECADPYACTALSPSFPTPAPLPDRCGDGTCDPGESQRNCPSDCGAPAHGSGHGSGIGSGSGSGIGSGNGNGSGSGSGSGASHCGNGMCEIGEDHASCPGDCCETTGSGACAPVCGNGFCESGENHTSCAADCCAVGPSGACL